MSELVVNSPAWTTTTFPVPILTAAWELARATDEPEAFPALCQLLSEDTEWARTTVANYANYAAAGAPRAPAAPAAPRAPKVAAPKAPKAPAAPAAPSSLGDVAAERGESEEELKEEAGLETPKPKRPKAPTTNCACGTASLTAAADLSRLPPSMRQPARRPKAPLIGRPWKNRPLAFGGMPSTAGGNTRQAIIARKRKAIRNRRLARLSQGVVL